MDETREGGRKWYLERVLADAFQIEIGAYSDLPSIIRAIRGADDSNVISRKALELLPHVDLFGSPERCWVVRVSARTLGFEGRFVKVENFYARAASDGLKRSARLGPYLRLRGFVQRNQNSFSLVAMDPVRTNSHPMGMMFTLQDYRDAKCLGCEAYDLETEVHIDRDWFFIVPDRLMAAVRA